MNESLVPFLFFERANVATIRPILAELVRPDSTVTPVFVHGFDFKEHIGQVPPLVPPGGVRYVDLRSSGGEESAASEAAMNAAREGIERARKECESTSKAFLARRLERLFGRPYFPDLIARYLAIGDATRRYLDEIRPRLAVIPEDTDYIRGRLAARILREAGIRSVVLLPVFYNLIDRYPMLGEPIADDYVVASDHAADRLQKRGVNRARIHVLGHSHFARHFDLPRGDAQEKFTLVYALQGKAWEGHVLRDLDRLVDDETRVLVKPHPDVDSSSVLARCSRVEITTRAPIDLISIADCVVSESSTVLYEAATAGVPIVATRYGASPAEIALLPGTPIVSCLTDFRSAMTALREGPRPLRSERWIAGDANVAREIAKFLEGVAAQ